MNKMRINYKGTNIEDIYKMALIGAEFATEQTENGTMLVKSLSKELYAKTVLLSRFLNVVDIPDDRVMNLEMYEENNYNIDDFYGKGSKKLKADYSIFADMLNAEINNMVSGNNDIVNRLNQSVDMGITPERFESLKEKLAELKNIQDDLTETLKNGNE